MNQVFNYVPKIHTVEALKYSRRVEWLPKGWVDRLVCWAVKKLDIPFLERVEEVLYESFSYDKQQLAESLIAHRDDIRAVYNGEIERIICGPGDIMQIVRTGGAALERFGPVELMAEGGLADGRGPVKFVGIPVQVIPWIEGIVFVPKMKKDS